MLSKFKNGGYFDREKENDVNGTYQGRINRLPGAFVRSASSDKLRVASQMSNSQRSQSQINKCNDNSLASSRNKITSQIYQKMLSAKLSNNNKQIQNIKNSANLKNQTQQLHPKKSSIGLKERLLAPNAQIKKCTFKQQLSSKQQQQIRECTFKPKINESKNNRRTLQQFIQNQMQFQKFKGQKVQQIKNMLKANMEKQNTFKPNINQSCRNNEMMRRNSSKGRIYERLYQQSKDRQQKHNQLIDQQMQNIVKQANRSANRISSISRPSSIRGGNEKITESQQYQTAENRILSNRQKDHSQPQNNIQQYESSGPQRFHLKLNEESDRTNIHALNSMQYPNNSATLTDRTKQSYRSNSRRNSKGLNLTNVSNVQTGAQSSAFINPNMKRRNQQIVINKFLRQIIAILNKVQPSSQRITYMQMSSILSEIKFISSNSAAYHSISNMYDSSSQIQIKKIAQGQILPSSVLQQRKYLYQIWEMLQGDSQSSISLISLLKIIFAILGCHQTNLVSEILQKKITFNDNRKNGGHYQKLILTEKDSRNLKARFQSFYTNRLKQGPQNDIIEQQYPFKPQISKNSVQMAQKYRMRVIDQSQRLLDQKLIDFKVPQSGQISHVDLLLLDEKRKQLRLKLQRQQQQLKRKIEQDEAMGINRYMPPRETYNPSEECSSINQTNQNESQTASHPQSARTQGINNSKFLQLYEQGKSYTRRDRSEDEVQAQKWQKQLTFKPHINPYNGIRQRTGQINNQSNILERVPDFDKAVFRMYEARKKKSRQQQNKQNPYSQQNSIAYSTNRPSEDISAKYSQKLTINNQTQSEFNIKQRQQIKQKTKYMQQNVERPLVYLNINMEGTQSVKVPVYKYDNLSTIAQKVRAMMGIDEDDFGQGQNLQDLLRDQVEAALKQVK